MLHVIFAEGRERFGRLESFVDGLEAVRAACHDVTPDIAARVTGIEAEEIRRLARDFATAPRAVCHGRMGASTQEFGALTQWLIQVLNIVTGSAAAAPVIGTELTANPTVRKLSFTGSTETARAINRALAARPGPIAPLIAETGGLNAMIVDSSALVEQVVTDVLTSAFNSAGQRCSALRLLFVQDDIAPRLLDMLAGAMAELTVGDPALLSTDVGPVIDPDARQPLLDHAAAMKRQGRVAYECRLSDDTKHGSFVAPLAVEIDSAARLTREVFGPILHVVRWSGDRLDDVIGAINASGYGLTLGVHSRIDATVERVRALGRAGNIYVNRNMIGAQVGVQPFGGEGLSGTGPKAGGPHYLHRFAVERTAAIDTTAQGGNATLVSLGEEGT